MIKFFKRISSVVIQHRYGFTLFAFLTAAMLTGWACVYFMKLFDLVIRCRLDFARIGWKCWITTPILFVLATEMIRRLAPCAAGTGIPQAIFAAKHVSRTTETALSPLTSPLTVLIKVATILIGMWACASAGREGPTVHIATGIFIGLLLLFRRLTNLQFDFRSAIIAGGAAGLATAFNTPLAGVTFAIEELSLGGFDGIKDYVLMAIIGAAIFAKTLTGEYTYFGQLIEPGMIPLSAILVIGIAGGLLGSIFSTGLLFGTDRMKRYKSHPYRYGIVVLLSLGVLLCGALAGNDVLGPGNHAAQKLIDGRFGAWAYYFPFAKIAATWMTYWSGIAGGIFAPCLSMGSAMGADIGTLMNLSVASCALVGMAAFLSGTIQAPMTSFVIIFEMTGHHQMLLPIMLASLIAFMVAKIVGARHLYQSLALNYEYLLSPTDLPGKP